MYNAPVAIELVLVAEVYQLTVVPEDGAAPKSTLPSSQRAAGVALIVGNAFTVISTLLEDVHPFGAVTNKLYVVLELGDAVGFVDVVELSPVAGDHA